MIKKTSHIASNPACHEKIKHIEIECYFVQEKVLSKKILTEFIIFCDQLVYILTKSLGRFGIQFMCSMLAACHLYPLA